MNIKVSAGWMIAAYMTFGIGLAHAQSATSSPSTPTEESKQPSATSTGSVVENDSTYKIGPQDVLRIDVWKEPDISRVVPVRPDGKVTLPLLNDVQAAGLTPQQLANSIATGLKKFITSPQVTVGVTEINSRRIFITGEVTRPGAYPLLPNMTVLQGLSSAGGFTQFAREKKIYILRMEEGRQVKYPFNYKDAVSGKHTEQNIILQGGDQIVVP
jgi:polysaccharide export outer membrane protein